MKRNISVALLGLVITVFAAIGFAFQSPLAPRPLQAQANCGAFNGNSCLDTCTRECTNGSCCAWAHYYYPKAQETM